MGLVKPNVVVNCGANSNVGGCEKNPDEAQKINCPLPLINALKRATPKPLLIHFSTDHVWDGGNLSGIYDTTYPLSPVNVYGKSKAAFERLIREKWPMHVILRSSVIYGPKAPSICKKSGTLLQLITGHLGYEAKQPEKQQHAVDDSNTNNPEKPTSTTTNKQYQ